MKSGTPWQFPIHRVKDVYKWAIKEDLDKGQNYWKGITEDDIRKFLRSVGKELNNGNDIPNMYGGGKKDRTRGWFATGESAEKIAELKPMQWRLILQKKLILSEIFREKQEEMFNDTEVSNNSTSKNGTDDD